jgi:hypothetical protein
MSNLPAELQHIDSKDMMLQQVALVNLISIVESGDDVLSAEDAIELVNNRIDVMDPASRLQAVEVRAAVRREPSPNPDAYSVHLCRCPSLVWHPSAARAPTCSLAPRCAADDVMRCAVRQVMECAYARGARGKAVDALLPRLTADPHPKARAAARTAAWRTAAPRGFDCASRAPCCRCRSRRLVRPQSSWPSPVLPPGPV